MIMTKSERVLRRKRKRMQKRKFPFIFGKGWVGYFEPTQTQSSQIWHLLICRRGGGVCFEPSQTQSTQIFQLFNSSSKCPKRFREGLFAKFEPKFTFWCIADGLSLIKCWGERGSTSEHHPDFFQPLQGYFVPARDHPTTWNQDLISLEFRFRLKSLNKIYLWLDRVQMLTFIEKIAGN